MTAKTAAQVIATEKRSSGHGKIPRRNNFETRTFGDYARILEECRKA